MDMKTEKGMKVYVNKVADTNKWILIKDELIFNDLIEGLVENKISLEDLSSGEQHELVVLYNLLFVVSPNTLILIDEPEISLHVEWQEIFIRDLVEIAKLSKIDVLLATHSPSIIHDRWDLTIQLKSPHDEKR